MNYAIGQIFLVGFLASVSCASVNSVIVEEFEDFKLRYGKVYENSVEESFRMKIFAENKLKIDSHNKLFHSGHESYKLRLNKFGDLTGVLEGQHFRKTGRLISLSEQNLVDCTMNFGNKGCAGGDVELALLYVKGNHGIDTEQSYPYIALDNGKCQYNSANSGADDVGYVQVKNGSELALQKAIALIGPISVAIDTSGTFQFYDDGVYDSRVCKNKDENLDHAVLAVGYGTDDTGKEYWIVKNSWGVDWGKQGYIKMARNKDNMCGISTDALYPLV